MPLFKHSMKNSYQNRMYYQGTILEDDTTISGLKSHQKYVTYQVHVEAHDKKQQ